MTMAGPFLHWGTALVHRHELKLSNDCVTRMLVTAVSTLCFETVVNGEYGAKCCGTDKPHIGLSLLPVLAPYRSYPHTYSSDTRRDEEAVHNQA